MFQTSPHEASTSEKRRDRWMIACAASGVVVTLTIGAVTSYAALESLHLSEDASSRSLLRENEAAKRALADDERMSRERVRADFLSSLRLMSSQSGAERTSGLLLAREVLQADAGTYGMHSCPLVLSATAASSKQSDASYYTDAGASLPPGVATGFDVLADFCTMSKLGMENTQNMSPDFTGAEIDGARLSDLNLTGMHLEKANFNRGDFRGAHIPFAKGAEAIIQNSNLRRINALLADFRSASFSASGATRAVFEQCDFRDARLSSIDMSAGSIMSADFRGAALEDVTATRANGAWVDFRGSSMHSVNFNGATLTEAKFEGSTLENVDFSSADLSGAIFGDASFKGGSYDSQTIWPKNFVIPKALVLN